MKPIDVKKMRNMVGLTAAQAAALVGLADVHAWQRYEFEGEHARAIPAPTERLFKLSVFGLPKILEAISVAAVLHKGQKRKGPRKDPYIVHPLAVARHLVILGLVTDPDVIAAAILHDVLEDGDVDAGSLAAAFGSRIAKLVQEVTQTAQG